MKKGDFSNRISLTCPCGNLFTVKKSRLGKSKYCSKDCLYLYRIMPATRASYTIINPKGKTGPNSNHYLFKGENACYVSIHTWVHRHRGKATKCEHCGADGCKVQWANKSHEYKRDLNDWIQLCVKCHRKYDTDENGKKRTDTHRFTKK